MDREALRLRIQELGFDVVRFVRLEQPEESMLAAWRAWLATGFQADMDWLGRSSEKRVHPSLVLPGARTAILLGVNYWPGSGEEGTGAVWARYALHDDYHDTIKAGLVALGRVLETSFGLQSPQYRYYVDTGPVLERGWAERGGVGFLGKNGMLISREFGNWLFLAEVLTVLEIEPDPPLPAPETKPRVGLHCGSCTRCIQACPTEAIRGPGEVDARRCISYHTIENKGIIPRDLRPRFGSRIYGCDTCLDVCPWNRFAQQGRKALLKARPELSRLSLAELLAMTPERFAEVFRRTAIKRTKITGLLRNACIVAANTRALECADRLVALASHPSPVVRAHAVWAVFRLLPAEEAGRRLADARSAETDTEVLAEYAAETAA